MNPLPFKTQRRLSFFWSATVLVTGLLFGAICESRAGLKIHLTFLPGSPPTNMVGGGTLESIAAVAAKHWEQAFPDPTDTWDVYLDVRWTNLTIRGQFELFTQGGEPHREQTGEILFNNTGGFLFFADPTPEDNCEYQTYSEYTGDLGGGQMNIGRVCSDATGDAAGRHDLLSLVEHEIGHALGMSQFNTEFTNQVPGNALQIESPFPYAGTYAFMSTDHLTESDVLMHPRGEPGFRVLISDLDIVAEAQLSSFYVPTLNPARRAPEITRVAITGSTLALSGTNGPSYGSYILLGSTNVALPVSQWSSVGTNAFDCMGNFSVSALMVDTNAGRQFFQVKQ